MNKPFKTKAVIFGAGNIGRSFIGNIFSSNGLEVTFIDANAALIKELNSRKQYRILIKRNGCEDEELKVQNIKAIHSLETEKVIASLMDCDLCSTSVGQAALPKVIPVIAESVKRRSASNRNPLDIIIAENIRNGGDYFKKLFMENGLTGDEAGFVETSIGKMVPIMTEQDLKEDPLVLHAEEYNTLILDKKGFKNRVPEFPEIKTVENIAAWVDRKLFIHNLGHAAAAYFGFSKYPERKLIADVLEDKEIVNQVRRAMSESTKALYMEYPVDFTQAVLAEHIDDLLFRFQNLALGDTVFRVGRDLQRKLGRDDRILGTMSLCLKHNLPFDGIADVFKAALKFAATDGNGIPFSGDVDFLISFAEMGTQKALTNLCGLIPDKDEVLIKILVKVLNKV